MSPPPTNGDGGPHHGETDVHTTPRRPRREAHERDRIRIKNRRQRYLDLHPEYFRSASLELADPLTYDRLIRRFLTPAERERQGRERGYTATLEADLVRSEAKLAALHQHQPRPHSPSRSQLHETPAMTYARAPSGTITALEADLSDRPQTAEEGQEQWRERMAQRFLAGRDADFDYELVDGRDEYDDQAEEARESLDEYLAGEAAEFMGLGADGVPKGETGVQDF